MKRLVGVAPIVQRPLASVIASDRTVVRSPSDLAGRIVGVTGLPGEGGVLDSVLRAGGVPPEAVHRVTIGFQAVSSLAAGKVAAATAFWNAEGVTLRRQGIPIRVFRVDRYGAPRYPELVLCTTGKVIGTKPALVNSVVSATTKGYALAVAHPQEALSALLASVPDLDAADQRAELASLLHANAFSPPGRFDPVALRGWARWDRSHGVVHRTPDVHDAFWGPGIGRETPGGG